MLRGLFSDKVYQCEGTRAGVRESTLLRVCRSFDEVRSAWRALENEAHVSPFETLNWCENWWQHVGAKSGAQLVLVNGIGPDGNIGFILPLMEKKVGPISIAQSLGDKNAAYLSPIYRTAYLNWLDRQHNFSLALELKNFFPNIDAFVLKAQVAGLDQTAILGRDFTRTQTGNTISSVELGDDWASFDT
ncbi:MAG: hypothetical protein K8F25_19315, partial [Fimbriimonadaceae bacterium]|nr:hypothetical protein [Alphaproteobacteria bacterium]